MPETDGGSRPRLSAVHSAPAAPRRSVPVQPALFPASGGDNLVSMSDYGVVPARRPQRRRATSPLGPAPRPSPRRRQVPPGQTAFEFDSPALPAQPFTRAIERRQDFPVAPLALRAKAVAIDLAIVAAFVALFLGVVRLTLGTLPLEKVFLLCYSAGALIVTLVYKALWCLIGSGTPGLQALGLVLISFDGRRPSTTQRLMRMFLGFLGMASAGMGILWAMADQETLSWHDHVSQTFLTKRDRDQDQD
jgi:uncharacterized RDD family membrane protein YckC